MTTPVYVNLDYEQYKAFERQFEQGCGPLETTHSRDDARFYHKAIRFVMGDLTFEVTGPGVMAPEMPAMTCEPGSDVDPDEEAAHDAWVSEQQAKEPQNR